jgi:hypothetical protein
LHAFMEGEKLSREQQLAQWRERKSQAANGSRKPLMPKGKSTGPIVRRRASKGTENVLTGSKRKRVDAPAASSASVRASGKKDVSVDRPTQARGMAAPSASSASTTQVNSKRGACLTHIQPSAPRSPSGLVTTSAESLRLLAEVKHWETQWHALSTKLEAANSELSTWRERARIAEESVESERVLKRARVDVGVATDPSPPCVDACVETDPRT